MIVIHYSTSFKALNEHIITYNHSRPLGEQVRQGATATAREIIRIFGLSLAKTNTLQQFDLSNLPPLTTNNAQLAKMTGTCTRTIRRHLIRLLSAGIIIRKLWHGSNSSFELWINPKILLPRKKSSYSEATRELENTLSNRVVAPKGKAYPDKNGTNCPHTDTGNNKNNKIIDVDNPLYAIDPIRSKKCSLKLTVNQLGDDTGDTGGKTDRNTQKKQGGKRGVHRRHLHWGAAGSCLSTDLADSASLSFYVKMLWTLAKNVLYKNRYLTEKQEETAQNLLYQWYAPVPRNKLARVHEVYTERITLVRKYIQKDPQNRFVQLPNRYFDPKNLNGFAGTKKWWKKQQIRREEVKTQLILNAQLRRFLNNDLKAAEERKPPLQLYRECESRISKLGKPLLLQQFHEAILNTKIDKQLYPKHS